MALVSPAPYHAFAKVMARSFPSALKPESIFASQGVAPGAIVHATAVLEAGVTVDPGAVIGPGAEIGAGTVVASHAVIGPQVRIGRNCSIGAGSTIQASLIGNRVIIHPGARIGKGVFIDHGMGVVIGETCEIGDNVTLFQGVTLGGTGKEKGKRHPTIEDNVMIASGAKVLGSMRIGRGSKIGAGSVVLQEVPPNSTVVGVPGRVVRQDGERVPNDLDHINLPDPVADKLKTMEQEIDSLKRELALLKKEREECYGRETVQHVD